MINRPCTITRQVETDETGDYGRKKTRPVSVDTVCEIQLAQQREAEAEEGDRTDTLFDGFFLAGTEIDATAQIRVHDTDEIYDVVGDAPTWRNPRTQTLSHIEVPLRRAAAPKSIEEGEGS